MNPKLGKIDRDLMTKNEYEKVIDIFTVNYQVLLFALNAGCISSCYLLSMQRTIERSQLEKNKNIST